MFYTDISLTEFPEQISLVLYTPSCLCRCPWCFNGSLIEKKPLSYKQMKDAIDEQGDFIDGVVFSGGEPLLNPHLYKIVRYAKDCNLKVKINTNGIVFKKCSQNWHLPYVDHINISIKGTPAEYSYLCSKDIYGHLIPHADILEYSLVYSQCIWPKVYLETLHRFLQQKINKDWFTSFSDAHWSRPDIFTISQMQVGDCLDSRYNSCSVPSEEECINVAKIFSDIPMKNLAVETKEFGKKNINSF